MKKKKKIGEMITREKKGGEEKGVEKGEENTAKGEDKGEGRFGEGTRRTR